MTNDTKFPTVSSALTVLINSAQAVADADTALQDRARRVRDIAHGLIDTPYGVNGLGELQGSGPQLDVACGVLEATVKSFQMTFHYLGEALDLDDDQIEVQWFNQLVERCPRLAREIERARA
jgi:hypothetical protein